jgi:hypothetical protein
MASTPEGKVKDACKKMLNRHEVYFFMPVSNGMGSMGVFDIVACADGVFVGIECKSDSSKKPTALQTHNATKAKKAGGVIFLVHVDNITDLEDTIIQIKVGERGTDRLSFWPFSG